MKKIFTLLLVLTLCVSTAITAFAAENANEYNTITEAGVTVNGKEAKVLFENDEYAFCEWPNVGWEVCNYATRYWFWI